MNSKGLRRKSIFSSGPFFPVLLRVFCPLLLFPLFLSPVLAAVTTPFDETVLAEVQALQDLKEKNPEVYQQKVQTLREHLISDVGSWRAQKPEIYQRFMRRNQERNQQHLEFVRQKRPDLYEAYQKRQEQRRKNRNKHPFTTAQERRDSRQDEPDNRPSENPMLQSRQQNKERFPRQGQSKPKFQAEKKSAQRSADLADGPRKPRIQNRPANLGPRQHGSFMNRQDRPGHKLSASKTTSGKGRQDRQRPRAARQRS